MHQAPFTIERLQHPEDAKEAYCCMAEVPTPWPEALSLCRDWAAHNLGRHLEGYHVVAEDGTVVGQLYYAPSELALVPYEIEPGAAVIYCDWIQKSYQGQGLSQRLFAAFKADLEQQGCKGILVEATDQESQMHFRHYLTRGFDIIHETDHVRLLYLPLAQAEIQVRPLEPRLPQARGKPVQITILHGYMCPFEVSTQVLLAKVAEEFGDQVRLQERWLTRKTLRAFGAANGIFVNGRQALVGAVSEEAIRQVIVEELENA